MLRGTVVLLLMLAAAAGARGAEVRATENVAVVTADDHILQFNRPFDLEGRTLRFTPEGDGYRVENFPLQFMSTGAATVTFRSPAETHRETLERFTFPFAGVPRAELIFDGTGAIRFSNPSLSPNIQFYDVHVAGIDEPLIAPLLQTTRRNPNLALSLREESSFLVATWSEGVAPALVYRVQAVLRASGVIEFSYSHAPSFVTGAAVVTPGAARWRMRREEISRAEDAGNDVAAAAPSDLRAILDLRAISASRIAATDIVELRIRTAAAIDRAVLGDRRIRYSIDIGAPGLNSGIDAFITATTLEMRPGNWTRVPIGSPAVILEGDTLIIRASDEMLRLPDGGSTLTVTAALVEAEPLDTATTTIAKGLVAATAAVDFSAGAVSRTGPVFEAFTRPYLDTYEVWNAVRSTFGLRDEDVDAVAIYSDLVIDVDFLGLAYSTVGNSGADGVMVTVDDHDPIGSSQPVRPALLLMADAGADVPLLIHELGHRWLLNVQIDRGDGPSLVLNSDYHPHDLVQTPSAFPAVPGEASCMGGTNFAETAAGVFSAARNSRCGFSWPELYLMGLAAAEEVPPWFYLRDVNRPIPRGVFGPIEVRGTKEVVTIDDLIRAMGPRNPSSATSRKTFRVVFVAVGSAAEPVTDVLITAVNSVRAPFATEFARVTGGRGSIDSTLTRARRRAISR